MNEQTRFVITDGKRFAVSNTGTIHLSFVDNWADVKVYKERKTAEKAIEKNSTVLGNCEVKRCRISYELMEG